MLAVGGMIVQLLDSYIVAAVGGEAIGEMMHATPK